jgi:hypothetical protein
MRRKTRIQRLINTVFEVPEAPRARVPPHYSILRISRLIVS